MSKRYVYIWFRHLLADWQVIRRPELKEVPFVFAVPDHGRMIITAVSPQAEIMGIEKGMRAADAKAICPGLESIDEKPGHIEKLLKGLGEWCIRYSPLVSIDDFSKDGLIMDISGCAHLWGGEREYIREIVSRFKSKGYTVRMAIADTIGTAWAVARFGKKTPLILPGQHTEALLCLPPEALRLEEATRLKLAKLGFYQIRSFIGMPRSVLRRRFGEAFLLRLGQALGTEDEPIKPLQQPFPFQERLPCMEPLRTRKAIETAIMKLLEGLCGQLSKEGKGLRTGVLTCHRIDGKIVQITIGTNSATHSISHLYKLFELKIDQIRPALGIELFVLDAPKTDSISAPQEALWQGKRGLNNNSLIRLLDRVAGKIGPHAIRRYLPDEHYWPERALRESQSLEEIPAGSWREDRPRPTELLLKPEKIEVMALLPDHPPKFFIYKGVQHTIAKADGPERIEREWWLDQGEHRDYYQVEDEHGLRYWLFRSGDYTGQYQWFIHGFFA